MKRHIALISAAGLLAASVLSLPIPVEATSVPQIQGLSSYATEPGRTLAIYGQNFGTEVTSDSVTLNNVVLPILSWTDTQIVVDVPMSGASGNLVVSLGPGLNTSVHLTVLPYGYYVLNRDGGVFTFGNLSFYGSLPGIHVQAVAKTLKTTPDMKGYWILGSTGQVWNFGDATFYGDVPNLHLNAAVHAVTMVTTPDGKGYWILGSDGGVFSFGDASYWGSVPGLHLGYGITAVGMAATPDGKGYWVLDSLGRVYAFGDAANYGDIASLHLLGRVQAVALTPDPTGQGYWILGSDGGVFSFGSAQYFGSVPGLHLGVAVHAVSMEPTPDGRGYWILGSDGGVFSFGESPFFGSVPGLHLPVAPAAARAMAVGGPTSPYSMFNLGFGWFNPQNNAYPGTSYGSLINQYSHMSAIAPDWYEAQGSGSVVPWNGSYYSQVTTFAKTHGVAVYPMIDWLPGNPNATPLPIDNASTTATLVNNIAALVQSQGYSGVTIDFESMGSGQASAFSSFIAQLSARLHSFGAKVIVAVYPATGYESWSNYNYSALGQSADYVDIMAYPYSNSTTYPFANSPYAWDEAILNYATQNIPRGKILLGIAPYGHSWTFSNSVNYRGEGQGGWLSGDLTEIQLDHILSTLQYNNRPATQYWDPSVKELVTLSGSSAAQAPTAPLSYNVSATYPSVWALQTELNLVLAAYAASHNQAAPAQIVTDGYYGSTTTAAVQLFQQEFGVQTSLPGTYDSATEAALQSALQQYSIPGTWSWMETARSIQDRIGLVGQYQLAGVAAWRYGFEDSAYWQVVQNSGPIYHPPVP